MTAFGRPHVHHRLTDSTNRRARALAEAGAPSGTLVSAGGQSVGRGRLGRSWTTPPGKALLCSALLRPLGPEHALLPLAVPLAVAEAIEALAPVECRLKWPNDVWIAERKVAGVLIEARPPEWAVIGVGVNVAIEPGEFPAALRWPATSVGHGVGAGQLREALCAALGRWAEAPHERVVEAFGERDALRGRAVSWSGAGSGAGTAAGIDARGNLLVERPGGELAALGSGEVSLSLG